MENVCDKKKTSFSFILFSTHHKAFSKNPFAFLRAVVVIFEETVQCMLFYIKNFYLCDWFLTCHNWWGIVLRSPKLDLVVQAVIPVTKEAKVRGMQVRASVDNSVKAFLKMIWRKKAEDTAGRDSSPSPQHRGPISNLSSEKMNKKHTKQHTYTNKNKNNQKTLTGWAGTFSDSRYHSYSETG